MRVLRLLGLSGLLVVPVFLMPATVGSVGSKTATEFPEHPGLTQFRASVDGHIVPVVVRVRDGHKQSAIAGATNIEKLQSVSTLRKVQQDTLIAELKTEGIRIWPTMVTAKQVDGSVKNISFRHTRLGNSFGAYVAEADLDALRAHPGVRRVLVEDPIKLGLDKSVNYMMGSEFEVSDRRLAVYGTTEEIDPVSGDSEAPPGPDERVDGLEGHGMYTAIIDSGTDWRHPMFAGTGHASPRPTVPGNEASASDHQKVVYYYNLTAGGPDDDHGHGTHTASTSLGFRVDSNTPGQPGYGTGAEGGGIGPTLDGTVMHGVSPAARMLGYKQCAASGNCISGGSTAFAIEDAVSPTALIPAQTGSAGDSGVAKPVADVISMSLSGGTDPYSSSAVYSNNAFLAGAIVVAAASNSGPDASTAGAPCVGTLVICVAANIDPGSIASVDVLAAGQVEAETNAGQTPSEGAVGALSTETGPDSEANTAHATERQAIKAFNAAGGGPIPGGSVSTHYVFADMRAGSNNAPPATGTNRIILVRGTGAFATIANSLAPVSPAAILIITTVESATAVAVAGGIPTFTISPTDANYLIDLMRTGDPGDGDDSVDVPHGTVSELPIRVSSSVTLDFFDPAVAGFSGRGPRTDFLQIKPDITGPGVGVMAATTPEGNPSGGLGMASPLGYVSVSGTSMSTPHLSGGLAVIRQYVRDELGFDTTDLDDPEYRLKRYEAAMISRAIAQNTATNLRSGRGVPQDSEAETVNDIGSGHMDLSRAVDAKAILVASTRLTADEFDVPTLNPPELNPDDSIDVLIPTHSFGPFAAAGAPRVVSKSADTFLRDITAGEGSGTYTLSWENNMNTDLPGVSVDIVDAEGENSITSIEVPSGGTAEFKVKVSIDGTVFNLPNTNIAWYVTATHNASGRTLRMPFYLRTVAYVSPLILAAPIHDSVTDTETPADAPDCGVDTNSLYTLNFSYELPEGGALPQGFRIQEATSVEPIFVDDASEPLAAGANSLWAGSEQWSSSGHPDTNSEAYFVPNAVEQNEALTMIDPVTLPSSASLTFDSFVWTEEGFDFAIVEIIVDGSTIELARYSGSLVSGTPTFDLSPWGGKDVRVQFRMSSDLVVNEVGWWVDNIRVNADDFTTIAETDASATSHGVTGRFPGIYYYRVAGVFDDDGDPYAGPYSDIQCVDVQTENLFPVANAGEDFVVAPGKVGKLSGVESADPEGSALSFEWTQVSGPAVTLRNANRETARFTMPKDAVEGTELVFQLTVTDDVDLQGTDTVTATVGTPVVITPKVENNRFLVGAFTLPGLLGLALLLTVRRRVGIRA